MDEIIRVNNLSFSYKNNIIFDNFNLSIKEGEWLSIVGPNGSGKSTLVKILVGLLNTDNSIVIDDLPLNKDNIKAIRRKIGIVFEKVDDSFIGETVADDIAFTLENLAYNSKEIKKRVIEIASLLKIEDILDKEPQFLSGGEKQKVAIAAALITNPKILIIDDALEMIDEKSKKDIVEAINKLHKENHLTIVTVTHSLEETYNSNRMVVMGNGKILVEGPTLEVLKEDRIFNRIGIEVPFMIDLSLKLILYGLIDHVILDMDEMVNTLWK
jgi:energy-coupling factor transport system ATP-binding protein